MELAHLITKLASQFQSPLFSLPGESFQQAMAPQGRAELTNNYEGNYNQCAVMFLLYPDENNIAHTVFFERKKSDSVHSGQIALPGGKFEEGDRNLFQTAIRETAEEVGVHVESEKIIGRMTPLKVPVSGYEVTPVIGYTENVPEFVKEEKEVERIIPVNIDNLINAEIKQHNFPTRNDFDVKAPYFAVGEEKVWGATSMMIAEFLELLK